MDSIQIKTSQKDREAAEKSIAALINCSFFSSGEKQDVVHVTFEESGKQLTIPRKAFEMLYDILTNMAKGNSLTLIPGDSEISTQQAAEILNVSRPHVVKLLEAGELPFTKAGKHRRVRLKDVLEYREQQKKERKEHLKRLSEEAQGLKLGYE